MGSDNGIYDCALYYLTTSTQVQNNVRLLPVMTNYGARCTTNANPVANFDWCKNDAGTIAGFTPGGHQTCYRKFFAACELPRN